MINNIISCEFNIDTACVEVKLTNGSNRDFGTTKAAKMYFSMSDPGPNAFATGDTKPVSFE